MGPNSIGSHGMSKLLFEMEVEAKVEEEAIFVADEEVMVEDIKNKRMLTKMDLIKVQNRLDSYFY